MARFRAKFETALAALAKTDFASKGSQELEAFRAKVGVDVTHMETQLVKADYVGPALEAERDPHQYQFVGFAVLHNLRKVMEARHFDALDLCLPLSVAAELIVGLPIAFSSFLLQCGLIYNHPDPVEFVEKRRDRNKILTAETVLAAATNSFMHVFKLNSRLHSFWSFLMTLGEMWAVKGDTGRSWVVRNHVDGHASQQAITELLEVAFDSEAEPAVLMADWVLHEQRKASMSGSLVVTDRVCGGVYDNAMDEDGRHGYVGLLFSIDAFEALTNTPDRMVRDLYMENPHSDKLEAPRLPFLDDPAASLEHLAQASALSEGPGLQAPDIFYRVQRQVLAGSDPNDLDQARQIMRLVVAPSRLAEVFSAFVSSSAFDPKSTEHAHMESVRAKLLLSIGAQAPGPRAASVAALRPDLELIVSTARSALGRLVVADGGVDWPPRVVSSMSAPQTCAFLVATREPYEKTHALRDAAALLQDQRTAASKRAASAHVAGDLDSMVDEESALSTNAADVLLTAHNYMAGEAGRVRDLVGAADPAKQPGEPLAVRRAFLITGDRVTQEGATKATLASAQLPNQPWRDKHSYLLGLHLVMTIITRLSALAHGMGIFMVAANALKLEGSVDPNKQKSFSGAAESGANARVSDVCGRAAELALLVGFTDHLAEHAKLGEAEAAAAAAAACNSNSFFALYAQGLHAVTGAGPVDPTVASLGYLAAGWKLMAAYEESTVRNAGFVANSLERLAAPYLAAGHHHNYSDLIIKCTFNHDYVQPLYLSALLDVSRHPLAAQQAGGGERKHKALDAANENAIKAENMHSTKYLRLQRAAALYLRPFSEKYLRQLGVPESSVLLPESAGRNHLTKDDIAAGVVVVLAAVLVRSGFAQRVADRPLCVLAPSARDLVVAPPPPKAQLTASRRVAAARAKVSGRPPP